MSFSSPQFFLLLPVLLLAGWLLRGLKLWRPLRACLLILLVIALCDPGIPRKSGSMDLWVLIDRSLSTEGLVAPRTEEWISLLESARPDPSDRIQRIDFAADIQPLLPEEGDLYTGSRELTRIDLAIRDALSRRDERRHHRILLFTDGYSTEPLDGLSEQLSAAQVPLDYRIVRAGEIIDYRIDTISLPPRSQPGEPFLLEIRVHGDHDGEIPIEISRNDQPILSRTVAVEDGVGTLRFSDRVGRGGSHRYAAVIEPEIDAYPGNNRYESWIEVAGGPRVLLISNYDDDPVEKVLAAQGFTVDVVEASPDLEEGRLAGARAVIFNNVPAHAFSGDFLDSLDFFVREQGGGLVMAGGRNSFGSGGYYQSAIDPLLPVTLELKSEHRRLAVAMAIVMDRSGSMGANTSSGHTKMTLANEGAAEAISLLGSKDAVTVFAVDSLAHEVSPLVNVGASGDEVIDRVRRVEAMGGGIFVYTGMKAAWERLAEAAAGQKHMILFTDAADTEEPGDYQDLLAEMSAADATVSVIGLGTRSDPDADLLEDIAQRGGGRLFVTDDAADLPNLFAQETVSVARSTFVEDPTPTRSTGRWFEIAARELPWLDEIDGYNLSYLREEDQSALFSADQYAAPLVALGRRGLGRTAAISFPLGGRNSERVRAWGDYGDFLQTLTRWIMGAEVPPGVGLRSRLDGNELRLQLHYLTEEWAERFSRTPPAIRLDRTGDDGVPEELVWERITPEQFSAHTEIEGGAPLRGAVQIGEHVIPFGPVASGFSPEWEFDRERLDQLRRTARESGGTERLDLAEAWERPTIAEVVPIRSWFFWAALFLFLLDALVTRTGWRAPVAKASRRIPSRDSGPSAPERRPEPAFSPGPPPAPKESAPARRRERFRRAKRRQ